jgi:hypothetical protein
MKIKKSLEKQFEQDLGFLLNSLGFYSSQKSKATTCRSWRIKNKRKDAVK